VRVLLVEDDDPVAESLCRGLKRYGFTVDRVRTGREALAAADHDLVLLDLGLPDTDGLDVCRELRSRGPVPIIVISARSDEVDRVVGLELGADDYVSKPFGVREVVARIRAVLRRTGTATADGPPEPAGRLAIDRRTRRVLLDGAELTLAPKEFDLLAIAAFTIPVAFTLTGQLRADTEIAVRREAQTAARLLAAGDAPSRQALARLVDAYERETSGRLEVELAGGRQAGPLPLPVDGDDEAFTRALSGTETRHWGDAPALGAAGLVLAVPARDGQGRVVGAVRASYPSAPVDQRIRQIWLFRAGLAVAVAALLGLLLARRLTRPLRQLTTMAGRLHDGDLTARAPESGPQEVRTLAQTLNNATHTIEVLLRSQRVFVADASHQLRTPLTALRLALDNVADGADDPESVREDAERATAEVVRMTRLVNGLLALARADAETTGAEPVTVEPVIAGRLAVWRAAAGDRDVTLSRAAAAPGVAALTTPGHLEQILDNLLANALDFSPAGAAVTVELHATAGTVTIAVTDAGPGMSAAERERAFDRFWRGPGRRERPGSGLGLAIVKQLVTDDGGTVRLDDAPGGGLAVRVMLRSA
jgi:two-component system OmpR family sensor kinase